MTSVMARSCHYFIFSIYYSSYYIFNLQVNWGVKDFKMYKDNEVLQHLSTLHWFVRILISSCNVLV